MTVKKKGKEFIVTDRRGNKILGRHKTRQSANKQLAAIEANKAKGK